jgi:hypothetical protein
MSHPALLCRLFCVSCLSMIVAMVGTLAAASTAQQLRKLSVGVNGEESDGDSSGAIQSANGRYVVYCSSATNLVLGGDANGASLDLYRHDNLTQTTERISLGPDFQQLRVEFCAASISNDGRFVSFWAAEESQPFRSGIFLRDTVVGTTRLIAQTSNPESFLTAGGALVAFSQGDPELGPWTVFIHDVVQNVTAGPVADGYLKDMSSDGRFLLLTQSGSSSCSCLIVRPPRQSRSDQGMLAIRRRSAPTGASFSSMGKVPQDSIRGMSMTRLPMRTS